MADAFTSDINESQLLDSISSLNIQLNDPEKGLNTLFAAAEKDVAAQQKALDDSRAANNRKLADIALGTLSGRGAIAEIEYYFEELAELRQAELFAKEHSPKAISGTLAPSYYALASYVENVNLDNAITDWLTSYKKNSSNLKTEEQAKLEDFLFGAELKRKRPKIGSTKEFTAAAESENWVELARIYQEEVRAVEEVITSLEKELAILAGVNLKETFFPTQPDKTKLEALEKEQASAQKQLDQFSHRLDRYAYYRDKVWGPRLANTAKEEEIRAAAINSVLQEEEDEKRKQEEVARAAPGERIQPTAASTTTAARVQTPAGTPLAEREIAAMRARAAAGRNFRDYLKDPGKLFADIGNLFRQVITGASPQPSQAAQPVLPPPSPPPTRPPTPPAPESQTAAISKGIAKRGFGALLSRGVDVILGILPTGVSQALLAAKKIYERISAFIPKEWKEALKNLLSRLSIGVGAAAVWFFINWPAALGAAIGGTIGAIGGPVGAAVGFGTGAFLGYQIGQLFGIGTAATPVTGAATIPVVAGSSGGFGFTTAAGTVTGAASGVLGAFFGGGTGPVITAVAGISIGTAATIIIAGSAFVSTLPAAASEGPKSIFAIEKSVTNTSLSNNSGVKLNYSVIISNATDKDIKISNVTDVMTQETKDSTKTITSPVPTQAYPQTIAGGTAVTITFNPYATDGIVDSRLTNAITVTAQAADSSGEAETQTATAVTNIGSVPNNQPFGYPASGKLVSIDARFMSFSGVHKGTFFHAGSPNCTFISDRCWIVGGMDILGAGGTPVYSTLKGTVIYAAYDLGSAGSNGHCSNLSRIAIGSKFMDCAVGGVVVIQSGDYIVSFLHLASPSITAGTSVERGQQIGVTYAGQDGGIPTVDGWHVHYQVLYRGANLNYASAPIGSCSSGAILPTAPIPGGKVTGNQSSICN